MQNFETLNPVYEAIPNDRNPKSQTAFLVFEFGILYLSRSDLVGTRILVNIIKSKI